jgi:hypothetical protein
VCVDRARRGSPFTPAQNLHVIAVLLRCCSAQSDDGTIRVNDRTPRHWRQPQARGTGVLRIHFTATDLARTRVAPTLGPLAETLLATRLLQYDDSDPFHGWRQQARRHTHSIPACSAGCTAGTATCRTCLPSSAASTAWTRDWTRCWPHQRPCCAANWTSSPTNAPCHQRPRRWPLATAPPASS